MNTGITMVPIHLDGLFINQEMLVKEAFAKFSRLPFSNGQTDYNPDTANISESVLSLPLQNDNLNLKRGMHLHWALPDALTKGKAGGTVNDYPAVPNRWLIRRTSPLLGEEQWIVESDYLHQGLENIYESIAYPIETSSPSEQPFRFLGRQVDANGWSEGLNSERLSRLTAIGYGEPAFAAFYPNCHSVFGCFDPDVDEAVKLSGLTYQLIGWFSNPADDSFLQTINNNQGADKNTLETIIRDRFSWNIDIDPNDLPRGMACFAELSFASSPNLRNGDMDEPISVSVGNTGTEALSAFLARQLTPENRIQVEEQLEQLLLLSNLQNSSLDLGPKFRIARHEKGFKATQAGTLWEVRTADEDGKTHPIQTGLPPGMADLLDEINILQQSTNRAQETVSQLKHILFADWYKYMLCAYPPDDSRDDYPDIDFVRFFIQNNGLPEIVAAHADLDLQLQALSAFKSGLEQQLTDFNLGTVASSSFFRALVSESTDTSGLTLDNAEWQDNRPFSSQCLAFDGSSASLSIPIQNDVKAVSCWVNLATQNRQDSTFLALDQVPLVSKSKVEDFWEKTTINGVVQPSSRAMTWHDLPKDQWVHLYIEFGTSLNNGNTLFLFSGGSAQFMKGKLASVRFFQKPLSQEEIYSDQNCLGQQTYQLKEVAAPRFWEPTEPVVLLEGESVKPMLRHGEDGRHNPDGTLDCSHGPTANYPVQSSDLPGLLSALEAGRPVMGEHKTGYKTWEEQPWHPFLLEWEVEVLPMFAGGNLDGDQRRFDQEFLKTNYVLPVDSPDLKVLDAKSTTNAAALYSGRSILTPYAKKKVANDLSTHLKNLSQADCYEAHTPPEFEIERSFYQAQLTEWFANKPETKKGLLDSLSTLQTSGGGWSIYWDETEGIIASIDTVGGNVLIQVVDAKGSLMETLTVAGSVVSTSGSIPIEDFSTLVVAAPGSYARYHDWYGSKPVYNNLVQGLLTALANTQVDLSNWLISWPGQMGVVDSVTTNGAATIVNVKNELDVVFTSFTVNGSSVTQDGGIPIANPNQTLLVRKLNWVSFFAAFTTENERLGNFNYSLIAASHVLDNRHFLSQSLSGFNNALLMHHQTLQLPIGDPLGFDDYQTFTQEVKSALEGHYNLAPLPLNDFLPIRSGTLRLLKLQLVDTFGQSRTINPESPIGAETVALPETTGGPQVGNANPGQDVWLPPRFVQPARINFRWLSANSGLQELNSQPGSTPICGWLLANHLDNSLAVYDQQGRALGSVDQEAKWRAGPGSNLQLTPSNIQNPHLRKVVERLSIWGGETDAGAVKQAFLQDFITATDKALENIDPESFVHHQELALLMGRPIAVVRASVNFELQGSPAIHHGWTEFRQDLLRDSRKTDGFEHVQIPIRIGERGQLNDGVLGHWREDQSQNMGPVFYTTIAPGLVHNEQIKSFDDSAFNLQQSLVDPAENITVLLDPRCAAHAVTGILPAKSIQIPRGQYSKALQNINITFLSAPILSGQEQLALPLPNELGFEWSWLARDRFKWEEISRAGIVQKDKLVSGFEQGNLIWNALINAGWIIALDDNRANVVPLDQRSSPDLPPSVNAKTEQIQAFLDAGHIVPVSPQATFVPKQTIREGWLKLSPSQGLSD